MRPVSRRLLLAAPLALGALRPSSAVASAPAPSSSTAKPRSYAATHGAAPFATAHLIPGAALDLTMVNRDDPAARVIALTIDDGPDPNDLRILEILHRRDARATFFLIGRKLAGHQSEAVQVVASGNEVGSHTQDHPMMTDIPAPAQARNLDEAGAALARVGVRPGWFRPPFGDFDETVAAEARARGMQTVLWTVDSKDWKGLDAKAIGQRVVERLTPGAVVLMHSTKDASVRALPDILDEGQRQGFRFVTLTEWWEAMHRASGHPLPGPAHGQPAHGQPVHGQPVHGHHGA